VSIGGVNFSSWYRQDEGTLLVDTAIDYTVPGGGFPVMASFSDGSSNNRIDAGFLTASSAGHEVLASGASQVALYPPTASLRRRLAITYRANDFAACVNGSSVSTDIAGAVPVVDRLRIGDRFASGTSMLNGTIRRLTYWPRRLDNNTLQELTR
jgi:hypothetical protein